MKINMNRRFTAKPRRPKVGEILREATMMERSGSGHKKRNFLGSMDWLLVGVILATTLGLWAQAPPPPSPASPASSGGPLLRQEEDGGPALVSMPVDPRIYKYDKLWLGHVARKVEAGTASMPELRAFYGLYQRLYPFDRQVPSDWRMKAMKVRDSIRPRAEAAGTWTLVGPAVYTENGTFNSGRGTDLWVDPADKNTIILGTADGGVWKTTNQGQTWISIFDSAPTQAIGCLTVDPNNKSVIYVGTGEANNGGDNISGLGIAKSTNGGASWSFIELPWAYQQPYHHLGRITVDPKNSQRIYAAGDGGLYISTNGGASFTRSTLGASTGPYICTDVVLDSVTATGGSYSIIYSALGYTGGSADNKIYRSVDGGGSWTAIGDASAFAGRIALIVAPSNPKVLYALMQDRSGQQAASAIFVTQDATAGAVVWSGDNANPNFCEGQCWYNICGAVDPNNPSKIVVGGIDSYISTNSGTTLSKISCWNCYDQPAQYAHADHHAMWMPDSNTIYDVGDGGFFIGTVSGTSVSWIPRNNGLSTLQYFSLSQHPTDSTKIAGGLQDNGHAYFNGTTWDMVQGGDGAGAEWDQVQGNYAYEAYVYGYIRRADDIINNPKSWTCIGNYPGCPDCNTQLCSPDGRVAFIAPMVLDPNDQNVLYTGSYRLLKNAACRTGSSWTPASNDLTGNQNAYITTIHPAKNNGQSGIIYVGTLDGKAQMTSNGGGSWQDRTTGLAQAMITGFTTHPTDGNKVLVTLSGWGTSHVYRSTNGGAAWTDITGGLPAIPFNCITLDPADPNHAYAGADMGVYENTAIWSGSSWSDASGNMPMAAVHALQFNPATHKLRAATHGRGVYELGGAAVCSVTCTATVPSTGTAGGAISCTSSATLSGCSGSPGYSWAFGDGQTSTSQNPSHTYATAGSYTWSLTVTVDAQTCSKSGSITISGGGGGKKAGDCDGNGTVSITELQQVVNNQLGVTSTGCGDCDGNSQVSITELQKTVNCQLGTTCDTNCQH
jgi:hypothetical protein